MNEFSGRAHDCWFSLFSGTWSTKSTKHVGMILLILLSLPCCWAGMEEGDKECGCRGSWHGLAVLWPCYSCGCFAIYSCCWQASYLLTIALHCHLYNNLLCFWKLLVFCSRHSWNAVLGLDEVLCCSWFFLLLSSNVFLPWDQLFLTLSFFQ